jgi:hypothetical protein
MGADASKDYKGPDNPETDNNIFVVDKFSNYAKDAQINSYNIWVLLVIYINALILLLFIVDLLSNLLYSRRSGRSGRSRIKRYKN